ncbi:MAG: hypothetical protein HGB19_07415 [Chlorobiales bacterium]|nr:hypothetical protein [Chlorobiales bacterium]
MKRYFFFFAFILLFAETASSQILENSAILALKQAAYNRDTKQVISYFGFNDELDEAVLLSLGSLQVDSVSERISARLTSASPRVREMAAFALGQSARDTIKRQRFEDLIFQRLQAEPDAAIKCRLMQSLGKFGRDSALVRLISLSFTDRDLLQAQALSIARFAMRNIVSREGTVKAAEIYRQTKDTQKAGINYGIYALDQIRDPRLVGPELATLLEASTARDPEVRMYALSALSRLDAPKGINAVLNAARDPDWRISVGAIRTLSKYLNSSTGFKTLALAAVKSQLQKQSNPHVLDACLESLSVLRPRDTVAVPAILGLLNSPSSRLRNKAMLTLATVYPNVAEEVLLREKEKKTDTPAMLEAVGALAVSNQQINLDLMPWLLNHVEDDRKQEATAALNSWGRCWYIYRNMMAGYSYWTPTDTLFEGVLLRALKKHSKPDHLNPAAVKTIGAILSDYTFTNRNYVQPISTALSIFSGANDVETTVSLLESLGKMKRRDALPTIKKYLSYENKLVRRKAADAYSEISGNPAPVPPTIVLPTKIDMMPFRDYMKNPVVVLTTSKGIVEIELFLGETTFTVANFVRLVQQHFYDGLSFHRVLPNFVVQGGDPNGDGTGSPGYTIRSEFTPRSFERGVVGMASAGKDTEGSQFFIMHSHHPHLDGNYTPFGKVVKGMDVVDQIEVGDKIISASIR